MREPTERRQQQGRVHPRDRRRGTTRGGRRPGLSREAVLDVALRIVDAEGLDAVTMRRVADELDTGPASLYAHVRHKDDLVEAMLERVIGECDTSAEPDPVHWQEQVKEFARGTRAALAAHNDLARATLGVIPLGPNALRVMDWLLGVLRAAGVPDQAAAWSVDLLPMYVGSVVVDDADGVRQFGTESDAAAYHAEVHEAITNVDPVRYPNLAATAAALTAGGDEERFEFGLDVIVRGIASTIPTAPRRRRTPNSR